MSASERGLSPAIQDRSVVTPSPLRKESIVGISQIPYKLPELAMLAAKQIREELELPEVAVEIVPLKPNFGLELLLFKKLTKPVIGIAGAMNPTKETYDRLREQFAGDPQVLGEIKLDQLAIGPMESRLKLYGSHLRLAKRIGASYMSFPAETTRWLEETGQFDKYAGTATRVLRKNGWGPEDQRPDLFSWDPVTIQEWVAKQQEKKLNVGTILAIDTVLRFAYKRGLDPIKTLYEVNDLLNPSAYYVGDYDPNTNLEKRPPSVHRQQIAEFIRYSAHRSPGGIYIVEVGEKQHVKPVARFVAENLSLSTAA